MGSTSETTSRSRKRIKKRAVELLGGNCSKCGYNRCLRALQFHHKDPATKSFGIADKGKCRAWKIVEEELRKCILLCANCHAEEEEFQQEIRLTGKTADCYSAR